MIRIAPSLSLPVEVATSTTAVLGIRGSGKTNTAGVICEELLRSGQPVCVIDPLDVWWGIKSSADGQSEGFPVPIFGGHHADIDVDEGSAKPLATLVAEQSLPCVISIRHLAKSAQRRFVADFCTELYHVKGRAENRTPLLVVIDEASSFVPQRVQGDVARCVGAVEDLVRRGRSSGIGVMAIDQRAASVNKDVLTQAEILIAHRHTSPQDREALKGWVSANASSEQMQDFLGSLASLGKGEAWVWSPHHNIFERAQINMRSTFDSSATPKPGESSTPKALAVIDIGSISASLANAAPAKSSKQTGGADVVNDDLQREIVSLRAELQSCREIIASYERAFREISALASQPDQSRRDTPETTVDLRKPSSAARHQRPSPRVGQLDAPTSVVPAGCAKPLAALAAVYPSGLTEPQWATAAGYKRSGGTWGAYKSRLVGSGLIERREGRWFATEAGAHAAGPVEMPPAPGPDLVRWWTTKLPGTGRVAEALIEVWPAGLDRDELALRVQMSPKGGTFGAYLSRLSGAGLITRDGQIRLSNEVMGGHK